MKIEVIEAVRIGPDDTLVVVPAFPLHQEAVAKLCLRRSRTSDHGAAAQRRVYVRKRIRPAPPGREWIARG